MRQTHRLGAVTVLTGCMICLGSTTALAAEDWPQWRGPRGDGISRETGLLRQWPRNGPGRLWGGYSSPVAKDGRVYLLHARPGKDILTAFDAETGKVVWSKESNRNGNASYEGTRATPTIDGSHIYTLGEMGDLICRKLADGEPVWGLNVHQLARTSPLQWGAASSPTVIGDLVYVQTGEGGPIAVAVDKTSGKPVWASQARDKAGYATIIATDVGGRQQLVVFGGSAVYGMDPASGKTLWREAWQTSYDVNAATPVYHDGHLFVSSEYNHGCMMLQLTPSGARKLWENREIQCKFQPPILDVKEGVLYANSGGTLKCMSWPDGKIRWSARRGLNLGAGGSIVRWEDKLVTLSERGELSLVQATPAGVKVVSQFELFDASQTWSTPLLYGGKLYAKGPDSLVCLDVGAK